jgi:hypothetical protein
LCVPERRKNCCKSMKCPAYEEPTVISFFNVKKYTHGCEMWRCSWQKSIRYPQWPMSSPTYSRAISIKQPVVSSNPLAMKYYSKFSLMDYASLCYSYFHFNCILSFIYLEFIFQGLKSFWFHCTYGYVVPYFFCVPFIQNSYPSMQHHSV